MALRFTVLASGSGGNASLVQTENFGVLIDAGLGPRQLAARLKQAGLSWSLIKAVLLTHTHSDHWKDRTLAHLTRRQVPLYCHPDHHPPLLAYSPAFAGLLAAGLVRPFESGQDLTLAPGLRCRPLPVRHDGGATFGFRLEATPDLFGRPVALGYVADLGCWDEQLAEQLADVDLLAVEFNHDVDLEYASGRTPHLITRVLGDEGHLSNEQAADLVRAVLLRSPAGRLQHLVQLHLSRDCNRPSLAQKVARAVLAELATAARLHTAHQDVPTPALDVGAPPAPARAPRGVRAPRRLPEHDQRWLPGLEEEGGPGRA